MNNWATYRPIEDDFNGRKMVLQCGSRVFSIERKEIPFFFNDYFWQALAIWRRWKNNFGYPMGGGWAEQNPEVIELIECINDIINEWTNARLKKDGS